MKKETLSGIAAIMSMLAFSSFILAAGYMTKVKFGHPGIWAWTIVFTLGFIAHIIAFKQLVMPIIWHSQQPKTQRQADRDRPYYRLLIELGFMYLAFSVAIAGVWIYNIHSKEAGVNWICIGLLMNVIPLGLMVIDGIRLLSSK